MKCRYSGPLDIDSGLQSFTLFDCIDHWQFVLVTIVLKVCLEVGYLKSDRCFRTNLIHFPLTTASLGNYCIRTPFLLVILQLWPLGTPTTQYLFPQAPSFALSAILDRYFWVPNITSQVTATWYFGRSIWIQFFGSKSPNFRRLKNRQFLS